VTFLLVYVIADSM